MSRYTVNPAHAVRGPAHVVKSGKTTVLDADEARILLNSIPLTRPIRAPDGSLIPRASVRWLWCISAAFPIFQCPDGLKAKICCRYSSLDELFEGRHLVLLQLCAADLVG